LQRNVSRQVINDKGCAAWDKLGLILRSRIACVSKDEQRAECL